MVDINALINAVINNGIGVGCAMAVLWFAWYRETKTIPDMVATFAATLKLVQESHDTRNNKSLDLFSNLVREERNIYQRWHEENRGKLDGMIEDLREQRHAIRNLANDLNLKSAVEKAEKAAQTRKANLEKPGDNP
jgi:hypothetical protein